MPSNRTTASDGGLPGSCWVLHVPGVIDRWERPITIVDVPAASRQHRRILVADLRPGRVLTDARSSRPRPVRPSPGGARRAFVDSSPYRTFSRVCAARARPWPPRAGRSVGAWESGAATDGRLGSLRTGPEKRTTGRMPGPTHLRSHARLGNVPGAESNGDGGPLARRRQDPRSGPESPRTAPLPDFRPAVSVFARRKLYVCREIALAARRGGPRGPERPVERERRAPGTPHRPRRRKPENPGRAETFASRRILD